MDRGLRRVRDEMRDRRDWRSEMRAGRRRDLLRNVKDYIKESERMMSILVGKLEKAGTSERAWALLQEIRNLHDERALAIADLERSLQERGLI